MFEKDAEEYARNTYEMCSYSGLPYASDRRAREQSFKDGAEFGYNKANEWHYVKDGLPKESKKYYVYSEEWGVEVRKFIADAGCFECRNNIIIAWQEIVLPKEIE